MTTKLTPDQIAMRYAMEHPEPTPEEHAEERRERKDAITAHWNAQERRWLKRIELWREELQRASAAPGIVGACILLKRYVGSGEIEVGALSLASRPKDASYQLPERSYLGAAFREYHDDPAVIAMIEKIHASWEPFSIIQWNMTKGRLVPNVLHVEQYRSRVPHRAGLKAMFTEMATEAAAKYLLRMIGDHALRHDAGLPALPASSEEGRRDAGQAHPRKGDIIEEIKQVIHRTTTRFSKESVKRDTLAAHPEWDQESRDKVDSCVAFVWRSFVAKHRVRW